MIALQVRNIVKSFDSAPLLRDVSFDIARGEIMCLLGPSGAGKTTLLRIIAGLEQPERGEILLDGQNLRDVPVHLRGIGMMFQDLALFPHQNVFENVAFGLRMQNATRAEIGARVNETLELVELAEFATRGVNQLSGGEQQRVALARSLAPRPRFLMFDEPLGALDRILREQLVADLRAILKRISTLRAALYVTHDQDEAFAIADRIAIIRAGRIIQVDTPEHIYRAPADAFVAQFLGMTNLFPARPSADGLVETDLGAFVATTTQRAENMIALIRPERVRIGDTGISARVEECTFRAGKYRARVVTHSGARLIIETDLALASGAEVKLRIDAVELLPA